MNEITMTKSRGGQVTWNVPIEEAIRVLPSAVYTVTLRRRSDGISNRQRALLRKWFACMSTFLNVRANEIHDWYCKEFLSYHTAFMGGADVCHGTSGLTIAQMTEFMNKVKEHARKHFGIELPEAGENKAFDEIF